MNACRWMDLDAVNLFLARLKLSINVVDKRGYTALMLMMVMVAHLVPLDVDKAVLTHPEIDLNRLDKNGKAASWWAYRC
jgi:hypothetical protein